MSKCPLILLTHDYGSCARLPGCMISKSCVRFRIRAQCSAVSRHEMYLLQHITGKCIYAI